MYEYSAVLHRVIDGDTVVLTLDLGFFVTLTETFRLVGFDAPERYEDAGPAATRALYELLVDQPLKVQTQKGRSTDKYGRWLADIILPDGSKVSHRMVEMGHVKALT